MADEFDRTAAQIVVSGFVFVFVQAAQVGPYFRQGGSRAA